MSQSHGRFLRTALFVVILASIVLAGTLAEAGGFLAGAAAVDITPRNSPPNPPSIVAGGFLEGRADRVHDPLLVRAIVLDDGGGEGRGAVRIALVVVDSCMMPQTLIDEAKSQAAARCSIPIERMMVSATHTHSAPAAMSCLGTRLDAAYAARLPEAIADAIVAANDRLEPASIGWGSFDDWHHTHNRRWIRRPETRVGDPFGNLTGLANMHPGHLSKDVIGPSGPVDPQLSVLSIRTAQGKPLAVFANYSQHYFGSPAISSDYFGPFCRIVASALSESGDGNGPFVCALSQGTSGDLMWMDYGDEPRPTGIQEYAAAVAHNAVTTLEKIAYRDDVSLAMTEKVLPLAYRVPDDARLAWARPIAAGITDDLPKNIPEVYAREAMILHDRQQTTLKLQAIRIGDVTIATLPNEVYALTGLKLRNRSPAAMHFNIELANGAEGYIPPPEQHVLGGYTTWPARTAGLEVAAETKIVDTLTQALEEVTGKPRRPAIDTNGPAATAVLATKPVGYWRIDDEDGTTARNSVAKSMPAQLTPGFAWYLPGVGVGTGAGTGEALVPSRFCKDASTNETGGESRNVWVNRAVHLAGGELVLPDMPPQADATVIAWVWLGERSGASDRQGTVCSGLSTEPLVARQDGTHALSFTFGTDTTAMSLRADDWHQVAIVRRGDAVQVHVDGSAVPSLIGRAATSEKPIVLGTGLQGKLDEVALFDRPLDAAEIALLWKASGIGEEHAAKGAAPPLPPAAPVAPRSPEATRSGIHVPPGFRVELVAAEPDVLDPVAFDWDHRGRLWVVEMADYPSGMDGKGQAGGRVRVLEDTDSDGRYETSRLFAEGLSFPNGILCWRDGVIVTAAPQILFLADTDGDGRCDTREVLIDGFMEGNQQLRVNGLRWGLDNTVWCASGGHHPGHGTETIVTSRRNGKQYTLGSHDFRFDPDSGELWLESGPSQFGRNRDAFGHWFGTQNANPLWHWVIADRYLTRNPYVPAAPAIRHVVGPDSPVVHPASQPEKRFHSFEQAGRFTSACGSSIYGDTVLFPVPPAGSGPQVDAFTCEPFHNLVQHNLLADDGVSFSSSRPEGEGPTDFFASDDRWCRPVMARTGPDGTLWVADMYRAMIEHPDWLTPEGREELLPQYRLGDDKGRIWRVVREGSPRRGFPEAVVAARTPAECVALLDSDNVWQRDLAQQLLVQESDASRRQAAVAPLSRLATTSPRAETRLQALCTLDGLRSLDDALLVTALGDPHPRVREQAVRLAERRDSAAVISRAIQLVSDPDVKVCLQLALSCGEWDSPEAGAALIDIAKRFADDPFFRTAVMSSSLRHADVFAAGIAVAEPDVAEAFREPLLRQSLGRHDTRTIATLLAGTLAEPPADRIGALDRLLADMQRLGADPWTLAADTGATAGDPAAGPVSTPTLASVMPDLDRELASCLSIATDENASNEDRRAAATLLARTSRTRDRATEILAGWLVPQVDPVVQADVLETIIRSGSDRVPATLAAAWPGLSPTPRSVVIDGWLTRGPWTADLLDRIESGLVLPGNLSLPQRDRLLRNADAMLAARATSLLAAGATPARRDVVDRYHESLDGSGDAMAGREVYLRACANCHRRGDLGRNVGPNLATVLEHSPERLLTNILDPNADIQPGYQGYTCVLMTGEVVTGLLAAETGESVTITLADGTSRSIARNEIEELATGNRSFMPEGIEESVTLEQMRDLLAFLRGSL